MFKPFQVFHHLLEHEEFLPIIESCWAEEVIGDPWSVLMMKLRKVKVKLKDLNKCQGSIHVKVLEARAALLTFQANLPLVPSSHQLLEECCLCEALNKALSVEEQILRQKSRICWLQKGDGNNNFFFQCM